MSFGKYFRERKDDKYCMKSVCLLTLSGSLKKTLSMLKHHQHFDIILKTALRFANRWEICTEFGRNIVPVEYWTEPLWNHGQNMHFLLSLSISCSPPPTGRKVSVTRGLRNRFYFTNNITTSTLVISLITSENRSHNRVHGNSNRKTAAAC